MSSRIFSRGLHYFSRVFESVCFECDAISTQTSSKSHSYMPRRVTRHVVQASFVKYTLWLGAKVPAKKQSFFLFHLLVIFLCLYFPSGTQGQTSLVWGKIRVILGTWPLPTYSHQTWPWVLSRQSRHLGRKTPREIGKHFNKQMKIWGPQNITREEKIVVFIPTT